MGLIRALKRIFNHNIQCNQNLDEEILHLYPNRRRVVKLGYNIIIRSGFCVVFVVNNKVTDVLREGKHKLDWSILQATFKRLKIEKSKKKCNSFKADIYFVNLNSLNNFVFESNQPFVIKTETFGKVVANVAGVCNIQINQADLLLQTLLLDRAYIKNKTAKKYVSYYVGNEIAQLIEKQKINFNQMLSETASANNHLNEVVKDSLLSIGLIISNVKLNCISCSRKKQQNKINEYLSYQNEYKGANDNLFTDLSVPINVEKQEGLGEKNNIEEQTYVNVFHRNSNETIKLCSKCGKVTQGNYCNHCGARLN